MLVAQARTYQKAWDNSSCFFCSNLLLLSSLMIEKSMFLPLGVEDLCISEPGSPLC